MNEEIATEGMRREKLEELIDRMHAFQNTEIESSNALKLELKAQKDAVSRPAKPTFMYLATRSRFRSASWPPFPGRPGPDWRGWYGRRTASGTTC